jgi:AraC-like DNA-binding protein
MLYRETAPHPLLAACVRTYWVLSGTGAELGPQPVLPDGCTELIVHRGRPFWQHDAVGRVTLQATRLFVGQTLAPVVVAPSGDTDVVAIRFEPFGAFALLGSRHVSRADAIVDVADLGEPWLSRAVLCAESADSAQQALSVLERALLTRLDVRRAPLADARVVRAVALLVGSSGATTIDSVARHAGTSPRNLERLFHSQIGLSPKLFARVVRLQATAAAIAADTRRPLADISAAIGYFDQAHMIRDFVAMTSDTPRGFRQSFGALTRFMLA